jgi:hypothetical protein
MIKMSINEMNLPLQYLKNYSYGCPGLFQGLKRLIHLCYYNHPWLNRYHAYDKYDIFKNHSHLELAP